MFLIKILFLKLIALLYPTSDFRHPITTPALTLLVQAIHHVSLTSLSSCRQSLLLIELVKQVKYYFELIKNIEEKCNYKFVDVNDNNKNFVAVVDFKSYIGILNKNDNWYVIGNLDTGYSEVYNVSKSKAQSYEIAYKKLRNTANKADIMNKTKEWLNYPPTDKQIALIKSKNIIYLVVHEFVHVL